MFSITLTSHKTSIDEIDVTYYLCDIGECGYKAKMASSVKTRKALIHEIDVVYYPCNKCNYEAKERSSLKKHKAGKRWWEFPTRLHSSQIDRQVSVFSIHHAIDGEFIM